MTAEEVIEQLGLAPHPEGGYFAETWRDVPADGGRGAGTAIYYLLGHGDVSRWHRLDATELWHFYAGAPVDLELELPDGRRSAHVLGRDLAAGERPQLVIPAQSWQTARPRTGGPGGFALVGCTVAPAFVPEGFELADGGPERSG